MANQLTTASNFPGGFNNVTVRGLPVTQSHPGQVFWVSNAAPTLPGQITGSDGNPGTFNAPFATIQYAVQRCVDHRGDIIFVKPGHSEIISSGSQNNDPNDVGGVAQITGALTLYRSGVAIIGLGSGNNRPTLTFTTAVGATINLGGTSASVTASVAAGTNLLVVTVVGSGTLYKGSVISGTNVLPGTYITGQTVGSGGGVGTYTLSKVQPLVVNSGTILATQGVAVGFQNFLLQSQFLSVTSAFTALGTTFPTDFTLEKCEFKDLSATLSFLSIVKGNATANSMDGLTFDANFVNGLGTVSPTVAITLASATDRLAIRDNVVISPITAATQGPALLATGSSNVTKFDLGRNRVTRPNTSTTLPVGVSTSGTGWTGHAYDNYFGSAATGTGIWISTGTTLFFTNNFCPITYAVDKSALINPVQV